MSRELLTVTFCSGSGIAHQFQLKTNLKVALERFANFVAQNQSQTYVGNSEDNVYALQSMASQYGKDVYQ